MSASVALNAFTKMLDECAPGHTLRLTRHSRHITYDNRCYPSFPKHDTIEIGHINKVVRFFGIKDCASKHFGWVKIDNQSN